MSTDIGGWLSGFFLVMLVFSLFIISAILRIRKSQRILRDPASTPLTRVLGKLGLGMDIFILVGTVIILLVSILAILSK